MRGVGGRRQPCQTDDPARPAAPPTLQATHAPGPAPSRRSGRPSSPHLVVLIWRLLLPPAAAAAASAASGRIPLPQVRAAAHAGGPALPAWRMVPPIGRRRAAVAAAGWLCCALHARQKQATLQRGAARGAGAGGGSASLVGRFGCSSALELLPMICMRAHAVRFFSSYLVSREELLCFDRKALGLGNVAASQRRLCHLEALKCLIPVGRVHGCCCCCHYSRSA